MLLKKINFELLFISKLITLKMLKKLYAMKLSNISTIFLAMAINQIITTFWGRLFPRNSCYLSPSRSTSAAPYLAIFPLRCSGEPLRLKIHQHSQFHLQGKNCYLCFGIFSARRAVSDHLVASLTFSEIFLDFSILLSTA